MRKIVVLVMLFVVGISGIAYSWAMPKDVFRMRDKAHCIVYERQKYCPNNTTCEYVDKCFFMDNMTRYHMKYQYQIKHK